MKNICVIAVHPDDETLGCGGTILKHIKEGDDVSCIFITSGNPEQEKLIDIVSDAYKFHTFKFNFPEIKLADISLNSIIPVLSNAFNKIEPHTIYIPNRSDVHSDHRAVFNAVLTCTKSFRYPFIEKVLMMEVISETDFCLGLPESIFIPNYYVDISDTFKRKLEILNIYKSEFLQYPKTRNDSTMESLNRYRGSQISCEYAETFMAIKIIER